MADSTPTADYDAATDRDWLIEILGRVNGVNVSRPKQRQAIEQIYGKEIDAILEAGWESDESVALRNRMADLLTRTANALKGDPEPLHSHDWSDLPDVAATRVNPPVECHCLVDIPHLVGEIAECIHG